MNFFEHQDQARKNTKKLIFLFVSAVVSLIAITTMVVASFLYYFEFHNNKRFQNYDSGGGFFVSSFVSWELIGIISFFVGSLILCGTLYKLRQLSQGGDVVATSLGGTLIAQDSDDADERKALNVVAEMAIASGTPIPNLYRLDESGINAFAAGTKPQNAAIGLTSGCISSLSRDELQGVVAHEFSHILHGDMLINMRLSGTLHGILMIGLIGRSMMHGNRRSRLSSSKRSGNNAAILGIALLAVGYIGIFFGKMIKSAVSRQREFLADASAVQFTRNPLGISGALKKIGGNHTHAQLTHPASEEFSHLFFGNALAPSLNQLFATHPPLEQRINRIEPNWNGSFVSSSTANEPQSNPDSVVSGFCSSATSLATSIDQIGEVSPESIEKAKSILEGIPNELTKASQNPFSARAIVYCLLLNSSDRNAKNWQQLKNSAHPVSYKLTEELHPQVLNLPTREKLPLFELCLPAIAQMSEPQEKVFKRNVIYLIKSDQQVSVFEWSLYRLLKNKLEQAPKRTHTIKSFNHIAPACQQLLSTIAHNGNSSVKRNLEIPFTQACNLLGLENLTLLPKDQINLPMLDSCLKQLNQIAPLKKPTLLKSVSIIIQSDNIVSTNEYELFRAIADCLDCPMPPL